MANKRILFISQEIAPYLSASRRSAALLRDLARKMQSERYEVRTFMPKFSTVNERRNQLHEVIRLSGMNIAVGEADHPLILKVASLQPTRIQVYFIDNEELFTNPEEDPIGAKRTDSDERAIFYALGAIETVKKLRWEPDIINCSGWITAFLPLYIKRLYAEEPTVNRAKVVYHVTDNELEADFDPDFFKKVAADGIDVKDLANVKGRKPDVDTLHRIGIAHADAVIFDQPQSDQNLLKVARRLGKPVLMRKTILEDPEAYSKFYKSLLSNED